MLQPDLLSIGSRTEFEAWERDYPNEHTAGKLARANRPSGKDLTGLTKGLAGAGAGGGKEGGRARSRSTKKVQVDEGRSARASSFFAVMRPEVREEALAHGRKIAFGDVGKEVRAWLYKHACLELHRPACGSGDDTVQHACSKCGSAESRVALESRAIEFVPWPF